MMRRNIIILTTVLSIWATQMVAQLDIENIQVLVANEEGINTGELEFSPMYYKDGIVFISTKYEDSKYKIKDKKAGENIMSIYGAKRNSIGLLEEAHPFASELLTKVHEGPVSFDQSEQMLYLTRNHLIEGKKVAAADDIIKLYIYVSDREQESWGPVRALTINDEESSTCHPALAENGTKMYFSSNRAGGYGGMDLYMSTKVGNNWSPPVNLGSSINTAGNEVFPFVHEDGTLYFASDGLDGKGGLDIFYTNEKNSEWMIPVNMGAPFCTTSDDFGFILKEDMESGYFSSSRAGGQGKDDIYRFRVLSQQKETRDLEWTIAVLDSDTQEPIDEATLSYVNIEEVLKSDFLNENKVSTSGKGLGLTIPIEQIGKNGVTNQLGEYFTQVEKGKYIIKATKDGYSASQVQRKIDDSDKLTIYLSKTKDCLTLIGTVLAENSNLPINEAGIMLLDEQTAEETNLVSGINGQFEHCLKCGTTYKIVAKKDEYRTAASKISTINMDCSSAPEFNLSLLIPDVETSFREGEKIKLPRIFYDYDKASVRRDARKELDKLVKVLKEYPGLEIELQSHTDSRGASRYNQDLSQRRAESVVTYLKNKGISSSRLRAKGYGEEKIVNRCKDGVDCSESEHQYNRRTEFEIIKFDDKTRSSSIETEDYNPVLDVGGTYIVIVGSFKNENYANDRMIQLLNWGYENAQLIDSEAAGYKAVIAGRFVEKAQADAMVKELEEKFTLNAYVKEVE